MNKTGKLLIILVISLALITAFFIPINNYFSRRHEVAFIEAAVKGSLEGSVKLTPNDSAGMNPVSTKSRTGIASECLPSRYGFTWDIFKDGKPVKDFTRSYSIRFPGPEDYSEAAGITCFRGNNYRNSASYGYADIKEEKLEKVWDVKIGSVDSWTGVGWNGQPAIIQWDPAVRKKMNLAVPKKQKDGLKEVIYATLDGKIYFLDLDDGKSTRPPINIGYPHKGSVSVDPRGYPLLYAGQGIDEVGGKRVPIGYRIFNLINQKPLFFINGFDPAALRPWGAFDSTVLVDKKTDTMIECGENGILYTLKLNTKFSADKGSISINPEVTKYRYHTIQGRKIGTENSVAIYKNFAYFADNGGVLQCVDLNTLTPQWIRDVTDDTDSTIALEESDTSEVSLYTACEVDRQGTSGSSYIRKINALTGELLWEKSYKCAYDTHTNGGALASPVVGRQDIKNLVIYNIAKTAGNNGGKLVAFDKKTGQEIWIVNLEHYCWSSPVAVYTQSGKSYLIVCDSGGNMFLIEGKSGRILDRLGLEANIEASPAVYENMAVVGTRGQKIFGVRIK